MANKLDAWEIEGDKSHEPPHEATRHEKYFLGPNDPHGCWMMTVTVESGTLSVFTCFSGAKEGRFQRSFVRAFENSFAVTLESAHPQSNQDMPRLKITR